MAGMHLLDLEPEAGWIDENGHMNVSYYTMAFDRAIDAFLKVAGLGRDYIAERQMSIFTVQNHINHLGEVMLGTPLTISGQIIDFDEKRLHLYLEMHRADDGERVATDEQMLVHVDMTARRACEFPDDRREVLRQLAESQRDWPKPDLLGRPIAVPKR